MSEKIVQFINYGAKHRTVFIAALLVFFSFLTLGIFQLKIDQSIYSILPKNNNFESLNQLINSKNINNKVFFLVEINEDEDEDSILKTLNKAKDSIAKNTEGHLDDLVIQKENLEEDIYNYYYTNFPYLINEEYYNEIENKINTDTIDGSIQSVYRNMLSPSGSFLKKYILNDPLYISSRFFKKLETKHSNEQMKIENGILFSKDRKSAFIYTNILKNEIKDNEVLYKNLTAFKENWNKENTVNKIDFFGAFQIAVENSLQVKQDSYLTVTITIIAILLILFIYYRKINIPLFFLLPTVFGGLFALGMMGYIHPKVSGLSLATGAILFGIILDYSFHFFTHLEHTKSIEQTIKDITFPLLSGGLTTILAFAALMFANSVILQDFGLFASLALSGAALFTLLILPIILIIFSFNFDSLQKKEHKNKPSFTIPKKLYPIALVAVVVITIFMYFQSSKVEFDNDITHLSYHKDSLKEKENKFVGINPNIQQKVYLFSNGQNEEQTFEINYALYQELNKLKQENLISNFSSTGDFIIPKTIKDKRLLTWQKFWNKNNRVYSKIDSSASTFGFSNNAFNNFKNWTKNKPLEDSESNLLGRIELDNLLDYNDKNELTILSTIVVENTKIEQVKSRINQLEGVQVFNRRNMAISLVEMVKEDFNFLLYISALIVFITLLVIYGRIELALLAFIPMVISWIWILGFAALLDIKFNFVNIVITTFIFGLGDDFSIFVTDGLLAKYKTKKDSLKSYSLAIILSAGTTMIGTGVLYFAKHPAIHSIALLSVIGIACILFISLIVQPFLFSLFVQNKVDDNKPPTTFIQFIYSSILFFFFVFGSFVLALLSFLLTPLNKKSKRSILTYCASKFAWFNFYSALFTTKNYVDFENLDFSKPSIIIANHSSFLDILTTVALSPKVVLVVKKWVYHSPIFGIFVRNAGYIYVDDGAENNLEKARALIENGYSIIIFPEGSRSENGELKRFHKGAFYLAKELEVDISPLIIHGVSDVAPKREILLHKGTITFKALPRIKFDDLLWGETYKERTKSISKYYKKEYYQLKNEIENAKYFTSIIFLNYVFKGPLLEWYYKIKWNFEAKNFDYYNQIIGDRLNIVDVGCGYGYFSFFLHYKNRNRKITALDYDQEKIDIAQNSYRKNDNLQFLATDITAFKFAMTDVIFYNDILHYLSEEEQTLVLNNAVNSLNENGILIIRDGITDLNKRHETTLKTEKYSTNIVGFNKKTRDFNFFSSAFIKEFAEENNLDYKMEEQSQKTSNVLFILTKK